MPVRIEWPQNLLVTDEVVDTWFFRAILDNMIDPRHYKAKSAEARAQALDDAGIIKLARQTTVVIPRNEKESEADETL